MRTGKAFLYTSLMIGAICMAFAAVIIKSAHAPGIVSAFYRMAIGSAFLSIPFVIWLFKKKKKLPIKGIIFAAIGGICFGCDLTLWSTGIKLSNATVPTIFANTAPIWVGIGSMLFFKEKHKSSFWWGLIFAVIGIVILVNRDLQSTNGILKGAMLGLGASIFYATFYMCTQPGRKLLDTLPFLFISTTASAITLAISTIVFKLPFTGYDTYTIWHFLALGLGVQVVGWFFVNYSQGFLPASIIAPTLLAQPLFTAFLAVVLINEHLTIWHIIGGIVIVAGIYLVNIGGMSKK